MTRPALQPVFVSSDEIRSTFAAAMSNMYRREVPLYGALLDLVGKVNERALLANPELFSSGQGDKARLDVERHGAIRLGTAQELATIHRIFQVMGMSPVGYYDLSVGGVPVHATAFRPVTASALAANPFRVFTSLLRLELITDTQLRDDAAEILWNRKIFSVGALELLEKFEKDGGLGVADAEQFVSEVLNTFRWHSSATVKKADYQRLHDAHPLIADVVCFRGPHINHLTPRTLDIDAAQAEMLRQGIDAKEVIEGPPHRAVPILLRQTSFRAQEEPVLFDGRQEGAHTARFGEVEQRGMALTRAGRALYDELLLQAREFQASADYAIHLKRLFGDFPDDLEAIRKSGLGYFRYELVENLESTCNSAVSLDELVELGIVRAYPITYEDFLPVSAAGIFLSNLGGAQRAPVCSTPARDIFELALNAKVLDEFILYEKEQKDSIEQVQQLLKTRARA